MCIKSFCERDVSRRYVKLSRAIPSTVLCPCALVACWCASVSESKPDDRVTDTYHAAARRAHTCQNIRSTVHTAVFDID